MNTKLTTFGGGSVALTPDQVKKFVSGIAESRASTVIAGGGKPLLRLLKDGTWVFGQSNEEVQSGTRWVVNFMTMAHGWCCWVDSELRGETMTSVFEPKPLRPAAIDDVEYKEQRTFEMKCIDGVDDGTEVLYKVNSIGGMRAADGLLAEIIRQLTDDYTHPCPVLTLEADSYIHSNYGKIYTPVITVVGWSDMEGNLADGAQTGPAPSSAPRKAAKPPLIAPAPAAQAAPAASAAPAHAAQPPLSTTQEHVGQRRRPTRTAAR